MWLMKSANSGSQKSPFIRVKSLALLCLALVPVPVYGDADPARSQPAPIESVLILYDSSGPDGWIGGLHARMLANLLGHFQLGYRIEPVESYRAGSIAQARAVFYFGTLFDNPLPDGFLREALSTDRPVCWFKYNLWQIGAGSRFGPQFEAQTGFRFEFMDPAGYGVIAYKGESFGKNALDAELGRATIVDPGRAVAGATACDATGSNCIPYLVHGGHFWYVADSPFAFIAEEDRYLIFADALHDILEMPHAESHRALVRLEDIDPTYPTELLRRAADYLHSEGIPFLVSVVPVYVDPLGYYNDGNPEMVLMSRSPEFVDTLKYVLSRGGQIVLHGYTHQYDSEPNPYTGVTGDDYEFFRVTIDGQNRIVDYMPVPEDSKHWALKRVHNALGQLSRSGLSAVAWQTPHYAASALDYSVFADAFRLSMERVLYFDGPGIVDGRHNRKPGLTDGGTHVAGQFFPYVIQRDLYGQKVVPENIGDIEPVSFGGGPIRLPADLIRAARKNRVVRDGWASGFFHPFLDLSYLQELVRGVKELGYVYVPLTDDLE
jgi:uncharacterized protein YdaL